MQRSSNRKMQIGIVILVVALGLAWAGSSLALAAPASDYLSGCTGEYFNNMTLAGAANYVRTDPTINFNWGSGTSPAPGVNVSQYSVRWTCSINVSTAGTYTISSFTDDGMNVLVDGNLLIWAWYDQGPTSYSNSIYLNAGTHTLRVEYYNNANGGTAQVTTNIIGTVLTSPLPTVPTVVPFVAGGYLTNCTGSYYNNISLSGSPAFVRTEAALNFFWREYTSPGTGLAVNNYSVRWTCSVNVGTAGNYTFSVITDDGMNVWVDNNLVIGAWFDQPPAAYSNSINLAAGAHIVRVEYYNHTMGGTAQVSTNLLNTPVYTAPAPAPYASGLISSCTGEYFNNPALSGTVTNARADPGINFVWPENTSPAPGINVSQYSVRWTCPINVPVSNTYTLSILTDDGMNVLIDGNLTLWAWYDQGATPYANPVYLNAGTHTVVVQYYNNLRGGTAQVAIR